MPLLSNFILDSLEADTLDSVTDRGATTTNAITIGNLTSTGIDDNASSNAITISSSQAVTMSGLTYPTTDGTANQVLTTDGSGALTFADTSSGGVEYVAKTTTYTASANEGIIANTSGGAWTLTLPASPSAGDKVFVADGDDWSTNNLTVARNGSTIEGSAADFTMDYGGVNVGFIYDGSTWQVYPQAGLLQLMGIDDNATSTALTIASGGNVGIGVTNPLTALDVSGQLRLNHTDQYGIRLFNNGSTGGYIGSPSAGNISFSASGGQERMRIDSSGNVGIGTASPYAGVSVEKSGGFSSTTQYYLPSGNVYVAAQGVSAQDNWIGIKGNYNQSSGSANLLLQANFQDTGGQGSGNYIASEATAVGQSAITFGRLISGADTSTAASKQERMRIDSSGRVGIGIATPNTASGNADNLVINENGNAGITIRTEAASGYSSIYFADSASPTVGRIEYQHGGNDMLFYTNGSERMRLTTAGNLGLGRNAPQARLDVEGGNQIFRATNNGYSTFWAQYNTDPFDGATYDRLEIRFDQTNPIVYFNSSAYSSAAHRRIAFQHGGVTKASFDGDGLKFNGDTAAANALDDYEEGTWTPTTPNGSWTVNEATYTKIGRLVYVRARVTAITAVSGDFGGLPFNVSGQYGAGIVGYQNSTASEVFSILVQGPANYNFRVGNSQRGLAATKQAMFSITYETT